MGSHYLLTHSLTPYSTVLLEKLTGSAASQEITLILWNPKSSFPYSQIPTTCPYPEPARSNPCPPFSFQKIHLNIILPYTHRSSKCSLFLRSPTKSLYTPLLSPIRATCPANVILLDLISRIILGAKYRS